MWVPIPTGPHGERPQTASTQCPALERGTQRHPTVGPYLILDLLRLRQHRDPGGGHGGVPAAQPGDREGAEAHGRRGGLEEKLPRGAAAVPPQPAGEVGDGDNLGTSRAGQGRGGPQVGGPRRLVWAHLAGYGLALGVRHRVGRPVDRQPDGPGHAAAQGVVEDDGELGDTEGRGALAVPSPGPRSPPLPPGGVLTRPAASVRGQTLTLRALQKTKFSLLPLRLASALATRSCRRR